MENWIPIVDFEHYAISDQGRVMNLKTRRILRPGVSNGYYIVALRANGVTYTKHVAQLVAAAYLPEFRRGKNVAHINGDNLDNRASNLMVKRP